ncbi:alpha/beta hydrolase [Catellatospora sichuanensis]|uniref:alpha/beta hydrolase n=1 Tax=Catellatospora sichuanensis TaxID=1969805 RepID=UPI0011829900|nr:alpha/beta hydrolase [Catellatospora sichuanensis]
MTVSYALLLAADPARWVDSAAAWRRLSRELDDHHDDLGRQLARQEQAWHGGTAAVAARESGAALARRIATAPPALLEVDQLLWRHAERIRLLQRRLAEALSSVRGTAVQVSGDGQVSVVVPDMPRGGPPETSGGRGAAPESPGQVPGGRGYVPAEFAGRDAASPRGGASPVPTSGRAPGASEVALAVRVSAEIDAVVREARASDEETARRLTALAKAAGQAWSGTPVSLPAGGTPADVSRWWAGLTEAERAWLVAMRPEELGRLDGVPAAVRDRANRELLDRELDRLRDAVAAHPPEPGAQHRLTALTGLAERLDQAPVRTYLLRLDPSGDGRVVVAFGDPDGSDNVATYVPGVGTSLDRFAGEVDRAAALQARASAVAPDATTATVMWLGYDPPDGIDAMSERAALAARGDLSSFQAGLSAAHEGDPARLSLIGHSYGSLAVGVAERDGTVVADEIVALGSPGMGVESAADLGRPGHVWASTARNDIVLYASSTGELALDALGGPAFIFAGSATDAVVRGNADLWHGVDPSSEQFGARVFASNAGTDPFDAHGRYFDENNPALQSLAQVVTGEHGTGTGPLP